MKFTHHWVADIFPLNESDIDRLAEDIEANGQRNRIIVYKGQIIDGRTRYAACKKAGVEPKTEEYLPQNGEVTDDELLALSWSLNEARRHLTTSQRACAAAEVANRMPEARGRKGKDDKKSKNGRFAVLQQFGVSNGTVGQALELLRDSPAIFAQVKRGDMTVGAAHEAFKKSKELEKAEIKRNSLSEIRSSDEDLAEQVENGAMTVEAAQAELEKRAQAERQRKSDLNRVATGLFVAVAGIHSASEAIIELKASIKEIAATRQGHEIKKDTERITKATEVLNGFFSALKERK